MEQAQEIEALRQRLTQNDSYQYNVEMIKMKQRVEEIQAKY